MQKGQPHAYRTLDGLRGVAALMVVTRHAGQVFPTNPFPDSFLAVDLFFLLSGFVVATAYEGRLLAGQSMGAFMRVRLIRLYPLYVLGIALGAGAQLLKAAVSGQPLDAAYLAEAVGVGVLMLPAVPPLPMGSSTLDGPTWTLLPELVVNLCYARWVRQLSARRLWAIVAAGGLGLVACERVYGTLDGGWWVASFPLVAARLAFSFFLGVAVFRMRPTRRRNGGLAASAVLALALALAIRPGGAWRSEWELILVLGVFPVILLAAVRHEPGRWGGRLFAWLGGVSYAVYVLHQPVGVLAGVLLARFGLPASWPAAAAFMLAVVAAAHGLDLIYDRPVRRWLSGPRPRPTPLAAPEAAR
jgi:peptidoglycan/LPS O-acetylase OafA/YrhL